MDAVRLGNPGECQAADSTSATNESNTNILIQQENINATSSGETKTTTTTIQINNTTVNNIKKNSPSPPPSSSLTNNNNNGNGNNGNGNANNKLKSQQQQQPSQQHYQFRAPQQFVKQKKSCATLTNNKKNKTWNKRQNKTTKQQQQQQMQQQNLLLQQNASTVANNAISSAAVLLNCSAKPNVSIAGGIGVGHANAAGGAGASLGLSLTTFKADLENIQNLRNHYFHNNYGHAHAHAHTHTHAHAHGHPHNAHASNHGRNGNGGNGNTCDGRNNCMITSLAGLEKMGYGHGHPKHQLCKKMLAHRGHHHHILCAGAAHNTLNIGGNVTCCNGGQNGKDTATGGINGTSGANNPLHYCCGRSKFFLPDKRLRKEIIIPPTKFLLGGNISDPLNLTSLQNETSNTSSSNNTPATTPRRSPITTPPKVEVIIPPNIHDPLHLLDPVDSMEYEKQLTSPMKRILHGHKKSHYHKQHRHRKNRKPKRRRFDTQCSSVNALDIEDTSSLANSTMSTECGALSISSSLSNSISNLDASNTSVNSSMAMTTLSSAENSSNNISGCAVDERRKCIVSPVMLTDDGPEMGSTKLHSPQMAGENVAPSNVGEMLLRERPNNLELNSASNSTCGSVIGSLGSGGGGGGRKRKISESTNSHKNKKFHRLDSMDKIVSPVVPQPGAWKRPPRLAATGGRKPVRRSTSVSETELLSPIDETPKTIATTLLLTEADSLRVATPDLTKLESTCEAGLGSPLSNATSAATSATIGEQETVVAANSADDHVPAVPMKTTLTTTTTSSSSAAVDTVEIVTLEKSSTDVAATVSSTTVPTVTNASATSIVQLTKMPKFTAEGAKYRYGNYNRYAGFRHVNEFMDVRLKVFQNHLELFQHKDILDIGCNVGHMTISVGRNLAPKSILGIDIDKDMITRARRNLSLYVRIPTEMVAAPVAVKKSIKVEKIEKTELNADNANEKQKVAPKKIEKRKRTRRKKRQTQQQHQQAQQTQQHNHHKGKLIAANLMQHNHNHNHNNHHNHHHHHHHHHLHQHTLNYELQQQHLQHELHVDAKKFFPISFPLTYGGIPESIVQNNATNTSTPGHPSAIAASPSTSSSRNKNDFPRNVFFRQSNYVLKDESLLCNDTQQYDLIMCLSVTKWIHLNFGDAGLKLAFKRMFNQLRPGGKLILEAQNWASYKKKKNLTEEIYNNYHNIEFFPNKFHEYLLSSDVGFSHSYTLGVPRHLNKGFCRPIQLYAKGDYTPNHVRWSDAYYPQTPFEEYRGIYATLSTPIPLPYYPPSSASSQNYDTPHHAGSASGPYSCRQTPMHQPTSQYYNPLETDSYLPSYDMEYLNHMYVFASPLYQTVWSPPASLRNSSSHTPLFGSVRDAELDGDGSTGGGSGNYTRHVYPPNDETSSPNANAGGAFNSIRDPDTDDSNQLPASNVQHVYLTNCGNHCGGESSSSPQVSHHDSETIDGLMLDEEPVVTFSQPFQSK